MTCRFSVDLLLKHGSRLIDIVTSVWVSWSQKPCHRLQAGESPFRVILAPVHMGDILGADTCIRRPLAVRERPTLD